MKKIQKPCVFITSTGRTGTKFFAYLFNQVVPDCDAFHEPGQVDLFSISDIIHNWPYFTLSQLLLDKFADARNVRGLSILRIGNRISADEASRQLYRLRKRIVQTVSGRPYVESNHQIIGLIDVVTHVFPHVNIIYMVRDPRDWLVSSYRYGAGWYGNIVSSLIGRANPQICADRETATAWEEMNNFQRNCWYWATKNRYALQCVGRTPGARLFKFEDIFRGEERYRHLRELMDFATGFGDGREFDYESLDGMLERKINKSDPDGFPGWREWGPERVRQFQQICGDLMEELGYGTEPEWRKMCREAGV
ncbi:MAG: sulfotransferase [Candidatus Brocadiia bacterium]